MTRLAIPLLAAALAGGCADVAQRPAASTPSNATAAEQFVAGVRRTVLPNGLTVLVHEQKGTGVVAINTWVKAGYFHEPDEVAGMAHLFEHMFFKGSKLYPGPEAISQAISGAGGVTNAGTIYDATNYYVVVPKESFVKGVEIQADAIANPLFDAGELKKEAEVVIEESNRKYDNAPAVAFEQMLATAFTQHRIKRWRIGSNEVLRNIKRENLVAFFETLYRPENIVVSVAGDVSPDEALATVSRTYGALPRGTLRKERGPKEPPQTAFRFARGEADIREGYTVFGWHTVAENHADEITLQLLSRILGSGRSSRLYRGAVGPKSASTASASHFTFEDVGVFSVVASHPEANRLEVERRLVAEIERMRRHGPTEYELAHAKNNMEAALYGELDTALEQAQLMSQSESRGSYRDIAADDARMRRVTAQEIQDAARRYLGYDQLTVYQYQVKGAQAATVDAVQHRIRMASAAIAAPPEPIAQPQAPTPVKAAAAEAAPRTVQLANGASLVVHQRKGAPLIGVGITFRGGRAGETAANAGITRLMQSAMRRGTSARDGEAIDRDIEFHGARLGLVDMEDGFGYAFSASRVGFEPVLGVVADVLLQPTFPEEGIAREKALQVAAIRRSLDSSTDRPLTLVKAALFGDHPYGLPDLGTEASVNGLRREALVAWWQANVVAARATVVVVGDVDFDDVRRVVEARLAGLPRGTPAQAVPPPKAAPKELVEQRERKQTAMFIGFPAVAPSHPDWPAMRLLQSVTSGLAGTFFRELRSRQSLAYTVFARPQSFAQGGAFVGYLACEASKEDVARRALLAEMRKLSGEGIQADEVARAKTYYLGSTRIVRESNSARATEYSRNFVLGLPLDAAERQMAAISRLGPDDLRAVARKYVGGDAHAYAAVRGKS